MKSNNDWDRVLDNATAEMRSEQIDSAVVNEAADRVWARLAAENAAQLTSEAPASERIGNCSDSGSSDGQFV
jgi:hypothetical protein